MSFRKTSNRHDLWHEVVGENSVLLDEVPAETLENEMTFRDYVTSGMSKGRPVSPGISQLSSRAIDDLWTFINDKAHFDMDATSFDLFNRVYQAHHALRKL